MPFTPAQKVEFEELYKKANTMAAKDTALVSVMYKLIDLLVESDQAYTTVVHAKKSQLEEDAIACGAQQGCENRARRIFDEAVREG